MSLWRLGPANAALAMLGLVVIGCSPSADASDPLGSIEITETTTTTINENTAASETTAVGLVRSQELMNSRPSTIAPIAEGELHRPVCNDVIDYDDGTTQVESSCAEVWMLGSLPFTLSCETVLASSFDENDVYAFGKVGYIGVTVHRITGSDQSLAVKAAESRYPWGVCPNSVEDALLLRVSP